MQAAISKNGSSRPTATAADSAGLAVRGVLRDFGDAAMAQFVEEAKADPKLLKRLQRLLTEEP